MTYIQFNLPTASRDKDDAINGAFGGSFAGIYLGLKGTSGLHGAVYKGVTCAGAGLACAYLSDKISRKFLKNN